MFNDPEEDRPRCRFRREGIIPPHEDPFEANMVSANDLALEINRRTEILVGKTKDRVSAEPIILQVHYKHSANLTIFDTPGFRINGDERLSQDIERMVYELIAPKHRLIVCLEQSTVEWANTISRYI